MCITRVEYVLPSAVQKVKVNIFWSLQLQVKIIHVVQPHVLTETEGGEVNKFEGIYRERRKQMFVD